ncbi:MAG: hypothetical protein M1829_001192 [Trizodia sp. TS-e1964]|nr:MAG: hypothetical protein M1829_001192 [Trizodia sp. TS-e1964]
MEMDMDEPEEDAQPQAMPEKANIPPIYYEYLQDRDLQGFLLKWHEELVKSPSFTGIGARRHTPTSASESSQSPSSGHVSEPESSPLDANVAPWDRDDLIFAVGSQLIASMTNKQITRIFPFFEQHIKMLAPTHTPTPAELANAYASSVVIDAILQARIEGELARQLKEGAFCIASILINHLEENKWPRESSWRVWRILLRMNEHWPLIFLPAQSTYGEPKAMGGGEVVAKLAQLTIRDGMKWELESAYVYRETLLAFQCLCDIAGHSDGAAKAMRAVFGYQQFKLLSFDPSEHPYLHRTQWSGRMEDVTSEEVLHLALFCSLLRTPKALLYIETEHLRNLLRMLYHLAKKNDICGSGEPFDPAETSISFSRVWCGMLASEAILGHVPVLREILAISIQDLKPNRSKGNSDSLPEFHPCYATSFAARNLLKIPQERMSKRDMTEILDFFAQTPWAGRGTYADDNEMKFSPGYGPENVLEELSLVLKLMQAPNASSKLAKDPAVLWAIAEQMMDEDNCVLLQEITCQIFDHTLSTMDQGRSVKYLNDFFAILEKYIKSAGSFINDFGTLRLVAASLPFLKKTCGDKLDAVIIGALKILVSDMRRLLRKSSDSYSSQVNLIEVMNAIVVCSELELQNKENDKIIRKVSKKILPVYNRHIEAVEKSAPTEFLALAYKLLVQNRHCNDDIIGENILSELPAELATTISSRTTVLLAFQNAVKALGEDERLELVSSMTAQSFDSVVGPNKLLLLQKLILTIDGPSSVTSKAISASLTRICIHLGKVQDGGHLCLALEYIEMILLNKPWAVNPFNTEHLLTALTLLCSGSSHAYPPSYAAPLYTLTTRCIAALLAAHRPKLSSQLHLVSLAFHALLRCLFTTPFRPATATATATDKHPDTRPPWLSASASALPPHHASAYARLLTTLCNPPSASVASSSAHAKNLTPATDRAKRAIEHHAKHLLLAYIKLQLGCRLDAQTKAALAPGFYALFDVLGRDTLATLMAAADGEARPLLRLMRTEYLRFGRWGGA